MALLCAVHAMPRFCAQPPKHCPDLLVLPLCCAGLVAPCLLLKLPVLPASLSPHLLNCHRAMGTQLMLYSVIGGMTATSSHLHSIMTALRALEAAASTAADAAASAAVAAPAAAAVPSELAHAGADDAASGAPVDASEGDGGCSSPMQAAGTSAAAAAGVKPVQEWVFEDVDCKGSSSGVGAADISTCDAGSGAEGAGAEKAAAHKLAQPARPASPVQPGAAAGVEDGQQSPLTIFKGAAQMLAMLLVMYLLLEVVAAVYKGRSPAKQLLASLLHLKELMGVMLVPLAMMCLGGVLAVWQFGLTGAGPALLNQQRRGQRGAMLGAGGVVAASSKGAVAAGGDGVDTDACE